MLLQSLEDIALRIASLSIGVYGLTKTNITQQLMNSSDSAAVTAAKVSAILSASEYIGDMLMQYGLHRTPPKLYSNLMEFGYAFVSNALVLMVMEKLNIDDKIVNSNSPEVKAVQWAVLFVIVQEVSHRVLQMVMARGY